MDVTGDPEMRITDDRYTRDRLRLDLALRLIRHEARTCTIRGWTGLSDDRIRKLYRSYVLHAGERSVRRHRGKPPRQPAYFLRNAETRRQAGSLAALLCMLGLLRVTPPAKATGAIADLRWGERFCAVFETFLGLHPQARISFEHAWFLQRALERRAELCVDECEGCGSLLVISPFATTPRECDFCGGLAATDP
jgi:hypothetical protein